MGIEIKRVPLDFFWPRGVVWHGYVDIDAEPRSDPCCECDGDGLSEHARGMYLKWWGYTEFHPSETGSVPFEIDSPEIIESAKRSAPGSVEKERHRLAEFFNSAMKNHLSQQYVNWLYEAGHLQEYGFTGACPEAKEVNKRAIVGRGFGSSALWILQERECKELGISPFCPACHGEGVIWRSEESRIQAEKWEPKDPPSGPGYQLWETVSEGSPISPVCSDVSSLAAWLAKNIRGIHAKDLDGWIDFIANAGWEPTATLKTGAQK